MMMFATDSVNVYAPCPQGICLYGSFGPLRCLFVAYSLPVCPIHVPIANPYSPIQCASIHRTSGPIYDQLSGIAIHRQRQRPAQDNQPVGLSRFATVRIWWLASTSWAKRSQTRGRHETEP